MGRQTPEEMTGHSGRDEADRGLAELVADALQRRWWQRRPERLLKMQRSHGEAERRKAARHGLWAAVLIYVAFTPVDFVLLPDVADAILLPRLVVPVVVLAIAELLFRVNASANCLDRICAVAILAGYVAWLVPATETSHVQSLSYYSVFAAIFMMGANLFFCFRFALSAVFSALILATFFAAMFLRMPPDPAYRIAFGAFHLTCFCFTNFVAWRLNMERYRVFLSSLQARLKQEEAIKRGRELLHLSNTDALTGLANRRSIDESLSHFWQERQSNGTSFGAILIDIDFFKRFNDFHGHQQGDRCLVDVARCLGDLAERAGATIGRYGGEEFIVLVQASHREPVARLCEAMRAAIAALAIPHGHRRDDIATVSVSVGASFTDPETTQRIERLINEADRALYAAKAAGRNCVRHFDPVEMGGGDESEHVAALLRIAIAEDLVSMHYQPIANAATGAIEAVEALMRLRGLDGQPIAPSVFIPIAERTGAIFDLGRWAIRRTCLDLLVDGHVAFASVNVSTVQLRSPGFAASVAAILGETGVAPGRLALEVTEGLEIALDSQVLACLSALRRLGVEIWLDDFGTGFAGLSWLRVFPFDTVKIDKCFLRDCETERGEQLFDDILALIRNRGHRVVVEGVETESERQAMRIKGVDRLQGFHVGRPAPIGALLAGEWFGRTAETPARRIG